MNEPPVRYLALTAACIGLVVAWLLLIGYAAYLVSGLLGL